MATYVFEVRFEEKLRYEEKATDGKWGAPSTAWSADSCTTTARDAEHAIAKVKKSKLWKKYTSEDGRTTTLDFKLMGVRMLHEVDL